MCVTHTRARAHVTFPEFSFHFCFQTNQGICDSEFCIWHQILLVRIICICKSRKKLLVYICGAISKLQTRLHFTGICTRRARPKEIFLPHCFGFLSLFFFFLINKCEVNCNSTVISLPDSLWVLAHGCHGNLIILACSLHILFVSLDFLIIPKTL